MTAMQAPQAAVAQRVFSASAVSPQEAGRWWRARLFSDAGTNTGYIVRLNTSNQLELGRRKRHGIHHDCYIRHAGGGHNRHCAGVG